MIPGFKPLLGDVNESFWFPPQASTFAQEVDVFFHYIMWICAIFFVLIVVGMVLFVMWYRRRPGYEGSSEAIHNNALEVTWTVIPTLIVIWIFARGTEGYLDMMRPPAETIDINVTARKWAWTFQYPNGAISDELHIPINKAVRLRLRSDDVLHSLFIPAFRCKMDVVPGRVNSMWFQAIKESGPDGFDLFCAEYCGDKHSEMLAKVIVTSEKDYDAWLAEAVKPPTVPEAWGYWLYKRQGCKGCHSIEEGKVIIGPSFAKSYDTEQKMTDGSTVKVDDNYIRESILYPQAKRRAAFAAAPQMQSFQGKLKDAEIDALTAFIRYMKDNKDPPPEK
ncbi:MAG: cytochrome c oxidase subunit II [Pirellulales bacterium]